MSAGLFLVDIGFWVFL